MFEFDSFFEELFISAIAKGENNTMLYGTFGQGLIVVPNYKTKKHNLNPDQKDLRGIATDSQGNVFVTQNDNGVIQYNTQAKTIDESVKHAFQKIAYVSSIDFGMNKSYPGLFYDGDSLLGYKNILSSFKDLFQVDSSTVILATSTSVYKIGNTKIISDSLWTKSSTSNVFKILGFSERCRSVAFDEKNASLYIASITSLSSINQDQEVTELLHNGKKISCNDLIIHNDKLWCGTSGSGILIYDNGELINQINESDGLGSSFITKIEINNNFLFVSHNNGFQILNLTTNKWLTLGAATGLNNGYVNDFSINDKSLWMLSGNEVLSIDLKTLFDAPEPIFQLHLDSIVVSDIRIDRKHDSVFNYHQNHFNFHIDFRNIEYQQQAKIWYKIDGFEKKWNTTHTTSNLIEYKSLPVGKYNLKIKVVSGHTESPVTNYSFEIRPPYWQTWWFYLLAGAGFCLIIFGVFKYRISNIRKKNRENLKKQALANTLLETRLKALRSQMNPHFIFNSLNSIQDLILKEDTDASYDYIVLFADLVRNTLNYSDKDFIPAEKELEFLEVYLRLEKLRFKDDFNYEIKYKGSKDIDVPSLIVQPFVENALQHGLFHKTGLKTLSIEFELTDQLTCVITDNGIGRKRANEIQERQGAGHESFALEAIKNRLTILKEQLGKEIGYEIIDLFENEISSGTQIVITIPYSKRF